MLAELWLQVVLQQGFKWWERVSSGSNVADLPSRGRARSACVAGTCRSCKGSADGRMTTTGKALGALFPLCDCVPCPLSSPRCLLLGMPTAFGAKRVAPSRAGQALSSTAAPVWHLCLGIGRGLRLRSGRSSYLPTPVPRSLPCLRIPQGTGLGGPNGVPRFGPQGSVHGSCRTLRVIKKR